jgi:nitroimidazol reductase NimA-like FMN-containing flavoprotein (pyridoxamine 5'-phosphate oxidase superfamily)
MATRELPQLEWIERDECLRLLASQEVGRIALANWDTPLIFPVNYCLDGETIVFRTDPGTKLKRGYATRASFEVDAVNPVRRDGWSVVVVGRLEEVINDGSGALAHLQTLPITPWAGGDKAHWMRLTPDRITVRRIRT